MNKFFHNLLCRLGFHKSRRIRCTHYNRWSGEICEWCGKNRHTIDRVYGRPFEEGYYKISQFIKSAGGDKPNLW